MGKNSQSGSRENKGRLSASFDSHSLITFNNYSQTIYFCSGGVYVTSEVLIRIDKEKKAKRRRYEK